MRVGVALGCCQKIPAPPPPPRYTLRLHTRGGPSKAERGEGLRGGGGRVESLMPEYEMLPTVNGVGEKER